MAQGERNGLFFSFRDSIKLLTGIITALAVKNALTQLVVMENGLTRPIQDVPIVVWLTFFVSIQLILRFFFGNIQYLNSDPDDDALEMVLDASTIIIQSMGFALLTNYLNAPELFFFYTICILLFDLIWYLFFTIQANLRARAELRRFVFLSQMNSLLFILLMAILGYSYSASAFDDGLNRFLLSARLVPITTFFITVLNLGIDLKVNGKRYLDMTIEVVSGKPKPHLKRRGK